MSDTPRMDAVAFADYDDADTQIVELVKVARQLERELAEQVERAESFGALAETYKRELEEARASSEHNLAKLHEYAQQLASAREAIRGAVDDCMAWSECHSAFMIIGDKLRSALPGAGDGAGKADGTEAGDGKKVEYNIHKVAAELKATALGEAYHGNALYVAKGIRGVSPDERSMLDRWLTGRASHEDGMRLQDLAIRLDKPATAPGEGRECGTAKKGLTVAECGGCLPTYKNWTPKGEA